MRIECSKKIFTYLQSDLRIKALQGARRAGKTYGICQWLLLKAYNDGSRIIIASMTAEQGRRGAYEDCKDILSNWGALGAFFDVGKTPRKIECARTNTKSGKCGVIEFATFDDPERAKGGACDIAFLNEANKFTYQQFLDISANARECVIFDYNPNVHFWVDTEVKDEDILKVSWQDNIKHLTPSQIEWFEDLKRKAFAPTATSVDLYYYKVYYLNEYAEVRGDIFTPSNIQMISKEDFEKVHKGQAIIFCDPSALCGNDYFAGVLAVRDADNDRIYIADSFSENEGGKLKIFTKIEDFFGRYDKMRIFAESNGHIGGQFIRYSHGLLEFEKPPRTLPIEAWQNRGDKKDRILSAYETIISKVFFVDNIQNQQYLKQVFAYGGDEKEHDDNIDAVVSAIKVLEWYKG